MSAFAVARLDELDALPVDDEGLTWRPVRRHFDIRAFGTNAYTAERTGQRVVEEHSEATLGHEELYVVVSGRATFTLEDEELDAPAGTLVFVRPGTRRGAVAAEDGTTVLVLGGKRGEAFRVSAWETVFAAYGYRRLGDVERGRALLQDAVEAEPDAWQGQYHLACFAALDGDVEAALLHLGRAVEMDPTAAQWAAGDEDFGSVRDDARFEALVGPPALGSA
jgi:mannose-6-phosphate isomerase-like protein (cupin superfamily)